jgi:hypothetical protein
METRLFPRSITHGKKTKKELPVPGNRKKLLEKMLIFASMPHNKLVPERVKFLAKSK